MEKDKRMDRIEAEIVTRAKDIEDVYLIELENLKEAKKVRYISFEDVLAIWAVLCASRAFSFFILLTASGFPHLVHEPFYRPTGFL